MCSHHIVWWALQLPMSPCRLYCPTTLSHLPHSSCSHMIRCILLLDIPHVLVVSGTLDMTPCFLDMLHVGGIWHIGHDIMLLTCVSLVIRTWCFVLALQLPMSPCRLYCPNTLSHLPHCSCSHMIWCILLSDIPHVWWFLAHWTWRHVFLTCVSF